MSDGHVEVLKQVAQVAPFLMYKVSKLCFSFDRCSVQLLMP